MTRPAAVSLNPEALSPSTDRTLAILEVLADNPEGASLADLHRELKISQNSIYRITSTLRDRGYLHRRESDKKYLLSNKLFELSRPRFNEKSLSVCAYESLLALSDITGETSQLMVRSGRKGVVLDQVSGRHPVKVMGEVGLQVPLYSCAPGKAILAWLPETEYREWLDQVKLKRFTPHTLHTRRALRAGLAEARRTGYAVDRSEGLEGIRCVAAPVFGAREYPLAAVTVMAPVFRLAETDFPEIGRLCVEAANEIRNRLLS